jgi:hypothetical protein
MRTRIQHSLDNGHQAHVGTVSVEGTAPACPTLQSWKEIASELNCGVRTVQRWERNLGLPVRRVGKGPRGRVIAFKDELDRWLRVNAKARTPHRGALLQDIKDFFHARQSGDAKQGCDQCGSLMKFLKVHLWIYATNTEWSLSLPFCPVCDADGLESFCRSQIIH